MCLGLFVCRPKFGAFLVTENRTRNFAVHGLFLGIAHDAVECFLDKFLVLVVRACRICNRIAKDERHGAFDDKFLQCNGNAGNLFGSICSVVLSRVDDFLCRIRILHVIILVNLHFLVRAQDWVIDVMQLGVKCLVCGFDIRQFNVTM